MSLWERIVGLLMKAEYLGTDLSEVVDLDVRACETWKQERQLRMKREFMK